MRGIVIIPTSPLGEQLAISAELQARLARLLDELEIAAGRASDAPSGSWRQRPSDWPHPGERRS